MTVKKLITELQKIKDQNANVYVIVPDPFNTGCDTCGYGAGTIEESIRKVEDLDGKVWLSE